MAGDEGGDDSLAATLRAVADDAVRLARAEIEFARVEAIAGIKRVMVAAALLAAAGLVALFMLIFALGAVPTVLAGHLFSGWVWWLLTAALFAIVAVVLVLMGIRRLRRGIGTGRQLVGSVKEDVAWLRRLTRRNASGS